MKRVLCFIVIALVLLAASCQSLPAFTPDPEARWGEPDAKVSPEQSPDLPELPAPNDTPVTGDVSRMTLTLPFLFGERSGVYTGALKDGLPHGYGRFTAVNPLGISWTYSGEWQQGHFHGKGSCTWDDGFMEEGEYQDDQLHGQGRELYNGILRYEGGFSTGCYDGSGAFFSMSGDPVYSGAFQNGYIEEDEDACVQRIGSYKARCSTPQYAELCDAANGQTGLHTALSGVVTFVFERVPEAPGNVTFLMADPDSQQDIVCVTCLLSLNETPPNVGQNVEVWGSAEMPYTYVTQLNTPVSVPMVEARCVEPGASPGGFET